MYHSNFQSVFLLRQIIMPVVTRYQSNRDLYESVLEQPLLLENILSRLSAKDAMNLRLTNNALTKQTRFEDTFTLFMKKKHETHLKKLHDIKIINFINTVGDNLRHMENLGDGSEERIRQASVVFDYLVDNSWFLQEPEFEKFVDVVERKLLNILMVSPYEYGDKALHYLKVLFGINLNISYGASEDDYEEYIIDSKGNRITLYNERLTI